MPEVTLAAFKGILQTDGYSGYAGLRKKEAIQPVGCLAHARRKFTDVMKIAKSKKPERAQEALSRSQKLYRIETQEQKQRLNDQQRFELRQREAAPIFTRPLHWK